MTRPGRGQNQRQKRERPLASAPTCRSSAKSIAMVQRRSSAESKARCAPQISRSAMAHRSRATSLRRTLQSAAASRAQSVPFASSCRTVARSRVTFFIGRCRSTRTLSLKDRRGELRIQRSHRRASTPKVRKKTFRKKTWPRPRYRPSTPSDGCIVPPPREWLRVIIDDGDDEVAEAKKREKALVEHVALKMSAARLRTSTGYCG